MSNVKERIFGAVTIMSDEDAEKVWNLIQATFLLNNVEEVTPDPDAVSYTHLDVYKRQANI